MPEITGSPCSTGGFRMMSKAALRVPRVVSSRRLRAGAAPLCAGPSALARLTDTWKCTQSIIFPRAVAPPAIAGARVPRPAGARALQSAARCLPQPLVLAPPRHPSERRIEHFAKTQSLLFEFDGTHQEASTSPQQSAVTRVGMGLDASRSSWAWQHGSVDAAGASSKCNKA